MGKGAFGESSAREVLRCFRKLRNLTKDAHRGRNGTSCPAMTPLRLLRV